MIDQNVARAIIRFVENQVPKIIEELKALNSNLTSIDEELHKIRKDIPSS